MSVVQEIQRIQNNVQNALDAIEEKGVQIPSNANSDDLKDLISQISGEPVLQSKSVYSSTALQQVKPDAGYDGLSSVFVFPISTATQATPAISVSGDGLITASSTQTAGYVSAGTKSSTKQLTVQAAQTITPGTSDKTIAGGRYLTGTQTIKGDSKLVPANIRSGVSIFGVTGTLEGAPSGPTPGLYSSGTTNLIRTWDQLIADGSIVLDGSHTKISSYGNNGLAGDLVVPEIILGINNRAFEDCTWITGIVLPSTVQYVPEFCFFQSNLIWAAISPSEIARLSFSASRSYFKKLIVKTATPPTLASQVFDAYPGNVLSEIIVPIGCASAYKSATNWSEYADIIKEDVV